MKQSDEKQEFETGAQRDTQKGKSRPDLVPGCAMLRIGRRYGEGAEHYGDHNFEKGIPSGRGLASLQRHLEQWKAGDNEEDHLSAVVFNAMLLIFNEEAVRRGDLGIELLDHPRYLHWDKDHDPS